MISGATVIWLIFLIVIVTRARGPRLASRGWSSPLPPERQKTPEELARERYARGEIGLAEYQEVLVNLLKDRYVQGELELPEYEERASRVLDGATQGRADASAPPHAPATIDQTALPGDRRLSGRESRPVGFEAGARLEPAADEPALDALRRRFLSGELTYQEYEEQRKRLLAA